MPSAVRAAYRSAAPPVSEFSSTNQVFWAGRAAGTVCAEAVAVYLLAACRMVTLYEVSGRSPISLARVATVVAIFTPSTSTSYEAVGAAALQLSRTEVLLASRTSRTAWTAGAAAGSVGTAAGGAPVVGAGSPVEGQA